MTVEQQVCPLKLAQKLRSQGVFGASLFGYMIVPYSTIGMRLFWTNGQCALVSCGAPFFNAAKKSDRWCALTVAELAAVLPDYVIYQRDGTTWKCHIDPTKDVNALIKEAYGFFKAEGKTQAEALGNMLFSLLYYRIITPESVNEILNK